MSVVVNLEIAWTLNSIALGHREEVAPSGSPVSPRVNGSTRFLPHLNETTGTKPKQIEIIPAKNAYLAHKSSTRVSPSDRTTL